MNNIYLELHVPDFKLVRDFYFRLGFAEVWEREPEGFKGYLVMQREGSIICFWGGNQEIYNHPHFKKFEVKTPGYGVEIVMQISNLKEFYEEVKSFAEIVEPLTMQPWGLEDFRIVDPVGYYIRITGKHDILDPRYAVA